MSDQVAARPHAERMPPARRRDQLLDGALTLAAREGLGAVNMESVARVAGVTKPVVYTFFANADAVVEALIDREGRRAFELAFALIPAEPGDADPIELARVGVEGWLRLVDANPDVWRVLLAVEGFPPGAAASRERLRRYLRRNLVAVLEWGLRQRPAGPMDAELLAELLISGLDGAARLMLADPKRWSPERIGAFAADMIRAVQAR